MEEGFGYCIRPRHCDIQKHKSVSHLENSWKSLWAKWFTNYILDVLCRRMKTLMLGVNIAQHCLRVVKMDSQTMKLVEMMYYEKKKIGPKLNNLHNFLYLTIHWQPSWAKS